MKHLNFDQQDDVFHPDMARPVTVIGAGSVGSQLVMNLARLGCTDITVYDNDFVSSHNVPMSLYRIGDVGKPKVVALTQLVREATTVDIRAHRAMYAGEPLRGAVVACVDSMEARELIWKQCAGNPFVPILVDTRMAAEFVRVFTLKPCDPGDATFYGHFLYPSDQATLPLCGWHGAIHVSSTAANIACASLTRWWKEGTTKRFLQMLCGHFQELQA